MAKQKVKSVYKATDGTHHETKDAAAKASNVHTAKEKFNDSLQALNHALLTSAQTADGHYLDWKIQDLYYVHTPYGGLPRLVRIYFWPMNVSVDHDYSKRNLLVLRQYANDRREYQNFYVNELYVDKDKAREALIAASKEKLQEFHQQYELMKSGKVDCIDV